MVPGMLLAINGDGERPGVAPDWDSAHCLPVCCTLPSFVHSDLGFCYFFPWTTWSKETV